MRRKAYGIDRRHTLCVGQTGWRFRYITSFLDGPGFEYRQGLERFPINCPDWRCGQLTFRMNEYRGPFLGVKRPGRDANHTLTTEVKNEESYTSAPPIMPSWSGQGQIYLLHLRVLHEHFFK